MTIVEFQSRTRQLAERLAPLLPGLLAGPPPDRDPDQDGRPDLDRVVLLELRHIISGDPELLRLAGTSGGPPDPSTRGELVDRLDRRLAGADEHELELLAMLFGDRVQEPAGTGNAAGADKRGRASLTRPARQVASACMNVLIVAVLVVAWYVAWPPTGALRLDGMSLDRVALAVFSVWCLSFLPGWLYVRFLGQRASALWDEYVLCLHRLGWDRPEHLPRPPASSEFFAEWFAGGGPLLANRQNIYRQKFDSYYGKSVSESSHRKGSPIKIETLFPVFLTTTALAVCWVAVLNDPGFVTNPTGVWDVLKFGFLGAYAFAVQLLIRRYFQSDLRPSAYASVLLRIITVAIIVVAVHQIIPPGNLRAEAVAAFVIGFFPLVGMQALQGAASALLRVAVPSLTPAYPLNQIDGLSIWYETRLLEEGIEDMESLATANFVDVILHTRVPVGRLVDWVDQAHLYLHLDRMDRGWLDRRLNSDTESAPTPHTVTDGSVRPRSRAGTRTRTALRQLGIRKATDLLKAFPPSQMDPDVAPRPDSPWAAHLKALEDAGLSLYQIRTMVRVLAGEHSLAPVWNWQQRGVRRAVEPATGARKA